MKSLKIILIAAGVWFGAMVSTALPDQQAGGDLAAGFLRTARFGPALGLLVPAWTAISPARASPPIWKR